MSIEIDQEGIMHRCHRFILPILAVIVMAGCSSPQVISATETTSHQPSKTPALTKTSTQLSPTRTSTPTTTLVSPPENILQYRPLEVLPDIPPDAKINDALVIYGDKPQILYFSSQRRIETFDIGKGFLFPISPDGKWLAYITVTGDTTETEWLVVESVDGKQRYINVLPDVLFFDSYLWLDNQHLIFPKFGSTYYEVKSMVVINPFTGEQIKLASVYPNLFPPEAGPAGRMNFNYSDVVYNPSLDLVIYPELNPPKNYIVLWDRRSGTALAKMETDAILEVYPLWSPDAKQVAVVNYQMRIVGSFIDEWFSISQEGQIEQLTHFGDYFVNARIGNGNWSPDGKKLAFWLETEPTLCAGAHIAILELATQQVTNTCIAGTTYFEVPPVWSLDSHYIALNNSNVGQTIIIDVEQWWAAQIPEAQGALPAGWLAIGP